MARGSGLHLRSAQDPGDTDPEVLASAGGREQQREDVAGGVVLVIFVFINLCILCFHFILFFRTQFVSFDVICQFVLN